MRGFFHRELPWATGRGSLRHDRLLPLPIARETIQLWEEIGSLENNEKLTRYWHMTPGIGSIDGAREQIISFIGKRNLMKMRLHDETNERLPMSKMEMEKNFGSDDILGIARFSTGSFHAALTLSGWNSGLGAMKFGECRGSRFRTSRISFKRSCRFWSGANNRPAAGDRN